MAAPYSEDLRQRLIRAVTKGLSCHQAAALFELGVSTAIGWARRWRETGAVAAKPMGGDHKSRVAGADASWVLALVKSEPDLTLAEIADRLRRHRQLTVSVSVVWRFLDKHKLTFKKNAARRRTSAA